MVLRVSCDCTNHNDDLIDGEDVALYDLILYIKTVAGVIKRFTLLTYKVT